MYGEWLRYEAQAVRFDPLNVTAWLDLAQASCFTGDMVNADKALQKAFTLAPTSPALLAWALQMYQPKWGGDPTRLKQSITKAVALKYKNIDDLLEIVGDLRSAGATKEANKLLFDATADLQQLAGTDTSGANLHEDLAKIYTERGMVGNAIKEYGKALLVQPRNTRMLFILGKLQMGIGQREDAAHTFREVLKTTPNSYEALVYLSKILASKDAKEGEIIGRKAISLRPDLSRAYTMTGMNLVELKKFPEAMVLLTKAVSIDRRDSDAYGGMVFCYLGTKQNQKAVALAEQLVFSNPQEARSLYALCYAYQANAQYEQALEGLGHLVPHNPGNTELLFLRGELFLSLNRKDEAKADWEKILTLDTKGPWREKAKKALSKLTSV